MIKIIIKRRTMGEPVFSLIKKLLHLREQLFRYFQMGCHDENDYFCYDKLVTVICDA